MARLFDDASNQYLYVDSTPVTAAPLTMACWYYSDEAPPGANQVALSIADTAGGTDSFLLYEDTGSVIYFFAQHGGAVGQASKAGANNQWIHIAGVTSASNSRYVYVDGEKSGENTTDVTPAGVDAIGIGVRYDSAPDLPHSGAIAEAAIWNVALTDAEVESLATGVSPLLVRPASLVAYWPLIRDEDQDRVGGYHMTPVNSPTIATHPPRVKPYWYIPWTAGVPTGAVECTTVTITVPVTVVDMDC